MPVQPKAARFSQRPQDVSGGRRKVVGLIEWLVPGLAYGWQGAFGRSAQGQADGAIPIEIAYAFHQN